MRGKGRSIVVWLASLLVAAVTSPLEAAPSPPNSDTQPHPESVAGPVPSSSPGTPRAAERNAVPISPTPATAGDDLPQEADRIHHLRRAEDHLRAAGRQFLADQIAREITIEEKLARIRKLQAEVAQLRSTADSDPAITLQVRIVELQVDGMRKAGFDVLTPGSMESTQPAIGKPIQAKAVEEFLAALKQDALAKVLAEPTLITLSGHPASLHTGGELPIKVPQSLGGESVEYRQLGTRIDCLPTLMEDGRIRLELRAKVSEIDKSPSAASGGLDTPTVRSRLVDTTVQIESGQTIVLGGLTQVGPDGARTRLLVFVTAEAGAPHPSPEP